MPECLNLIIRDRTEYSRYLEGIAFKTIRSPGNPIDKAGGIFGQGAGPAVLAGFNGPLRQSQTDTGQLTWTNSRETRSG